MPSNDSSVMHTPSIPSDALVRNPTRPFARTRSPFRSMESSSDVNAVRSSVDSSWLACERFPRSHRDLRRQRPAQSVSASVRCQWNRGGILLLESSFPVHEFGGVKQGDIQVRVRAAKWSNLAFPHVSRPGLEGTLGEVSSPRGKWALHRPPPGDVRSPRT
jgi:hypothetical protein